MKKSFLSLSIALAFSNISFSAKAMDSQEFDYSSPGLVSSLKDLNQDPSTIKKLAVSNKFKDEISNLMNLTYLDTSHTGYFSQKPFETVSRLTKLKVLDVSHIRLASDDIEAITSLPNLTSLDVTSTWMHRTNLEKLASMTKLKDLKLDYTHLEGDISPLTHLTNLTRLSMNMDPNPNGEKQIPSEAFSAFTSLQNLRDLSVLGREIEPNVLQSLREKGIRITIMEKENGLFMVTRK